MANINRVILVGNLGQDPETKAMPSGMTVCNLRIATSESWKDKQTGEMKEQTEWHSVAMFGRLAEIAGEYLKKGSQVYVEGRLRTRKWQDKQGNEYTVVYPNSFKNMRTPVISDIGYSHQGSLPEWMTSTQEDGRVLEIGRAHV